MDVIVLVHLLGTVDFGTMYKSELELRTGYIFVVRQLWHHLYLFINSWIFETLTSNSESKSFFSISSALSFKVFTATVVTSAEPVDTELK